MEIYQGSNSPIVLIFEEDITQISDFSAALIPKYGLRTDEDVIPILKRWSFEDIIMRDEHTIVLKLSQKESSELSSIPCILEVKVSFEGNVKIVISSLVNIYKRVDKTILDGVLENE